MNFGNLLISTHSNINFQTLFESSPGLYLILRPDFTIAAASDDYLIATMTERGKITGHVLFDVFPDNPDDPSATGTLNLRSSLNFVLQNGISHTMAIQKYDIRRPDGTFEERFWSPLNKPVLNDKKEVEYIIHRVEDVTAFVNLERKTQAQDQTARELRSRVREMEAEIYNRALEIQETHNKFINEISMRKKVEEDLENIFTNAPNAVVVTDDTGKILKWNGKAEMVFGWTENEVSGKLLREVVIPQRYRAADVQELKKFLQTKEETVMNKDLQLIAVRKNKAEFPVEVRISPTLVNGRYWFIGFINDISARRESEKKLRESEEKFRLLVETIKDYAIYMIDKTGHVISWNKGAEHIKGYKADEIIGRHFSIFYTEQDIRNGCPEINLRKAMKEGKAEAEGWRIRKDGSRFWADVILTALYDKNGGLRGFSKVTRDISERQKVKESIELLNLQLEQRVAERTEELLISEKKYRDLFQNNPMPMWILDLPSFRFLDVNESAIRNYGYSREEFLSMTALDIRPEDEKKRFLNVDRTTDSGPHSTGIWKHIKKDGTVIHIEASVHKIMFEGKWARLVLSNDITEKKKAESLLRISENRFRSIIEQFPYPVVTYLPTGDYTTANEAWEIMWQEKRENVKGYNIRKDPLLIASGLSVHVERAFAGDIAISEPYLYDPELIGQSGRKRWMQMTLYPLKNQESQVSEVILVLQDVTEKKESEEKILASEVRFRSLIENNNDIMTLATPDGNVFYTSPSMTAILGYAQEELLTKPAFELIHPDDIIHLMERVQEIIAIPGKSFFHQQRLLHKNGTWVWCEGTITNMLHEPRVGALVSNFRDITDRKEVEEEILKLNKELEDRVKLRTNQLELANNELEAFSYSISHDLRAPLRAINGYTRILKEDYSANFDKEGERVLHVIMNNTTKMAQLIDDLLAFSRLGRKEISKTKLKMNNIVAQVISEIKQSEKYSNINVEVPFLLDTKGDYNMIMQVWSNLIENAIKYSSAKQQVKIEIGSEENETDITYFIRDNGVGFDMQYADKLFGVFQRLHDEREFEGTGVGLAIVHRIINKFGGKVWAEGKVGEGATFYFSLPK